MKGRHSAFTLTELLVVLAIVIALVGVLLPVLRSARQAGYKTVCASNMRQAHLATYLYVADYDDRLVPVNHQPAGIPNSRNDRTWVQLVLPYVAGQFSVFRCPADYTERPSLNATIDGDLVPGDTFSQYYTASLRSNIGYNYLNFSPIYRSGTRWQATPRFVSQVTEPSKTLLYVDSVWDRLPNGEPTGGGRWLVIPPCRYVRSGAELTDTFVPGSSTATVFSESPGWRQDRTSAMQFGGAWPWHQGRMNLIRLDGSLSTVTPIRLAAGCDVRENWAGLISDPASYLWDLQ